MTDESLAALEFLAGEVNARRKVLGLSRVAVHERGGPSDSTLARIEAPTARTAYPRPVTLRRLDSSLRWKPGSAAGCLGRVSPAPLDGTGTSVRGFDAAPSLEPGAAIMQDFTFVTVPVSVIREGLDAIRRLLPSSEPRVELLLRQLALLFEAAHCTEVLERFGAAGLATPDYLLTAFSLYLAEEPAMTAPSPHQHLEQRYRRWLAGIDAGDEDGFRERLERRRAVIAPKAPDDTL